MADIIDTLDFSGFAQSANIDISTRRADGDGADGERCLFTSESRSLTSSYRPMCMDSLTADTILSNGMPIA